MTQGKGTTVGDLGSSLKKSDSPATKKKAAAASAGDADGPLAGTITAKPKPALGGAPKGSGGPKIYTCYMCGQGFSGSSLGIHQPKCQQKWLAEQAGKPAGMRCEARAHMPFTAVVMATGSCRQRVTAK